MLDLVTRKEWKARLPSNGILQMPSTPKGIKVHYTGGREDPRLLTHHELCPHRVRSIQNGHMDGNGWSDIGYSFVVCPHGKVYEGRGIGYLPAANGAGLNSDHYAILALVGTAGVTEPTPEMILGIRECIRFIRRWAKAGKQIKGHRDGYATECPGEPVYRLVTSGVLEPDNDYEADEEMPKYLSLGLDRNEPLALAFHDWTTLAFDVEYSDPDKNHATGRFPSFLSGKARFTLTVTATVAGLDAGVEGQVRLYEVDKDNKRTKTYPIQEWSATSGNTFVHHSTNGTVDEGMRLRAEIVQFGTKPVTITDCAVKALYWR